MNKNNCPQCGGFKKLFGRGCKISDDCTSSKAKFVSIPCDFCESKGTVSDKKLLMRLRGEQLKEWRVKQEITLRAAARKYNIDASNLSKMERGVINPVPYYNGGK